MKNTSQQFQGLRYGTAWKEHTVYVNFDGAKAMAASETIPLHEDLPEDFTERWCGKTLEGVRRIVDWVSEVA